VVADLQALQTHQDERMRGSPNAPLAESASGPVHTAHSEADDPMLKCVSSCTTLLSPGLVDVSIQRLVECITLRGALRAEGYSCTGGDGGAGGSGHGSSAGDPGSLGMSRGQRASVYEAQQVSRRLNQRSFQSSSTWIERFNK
jgi:hypothetical protein